MTGELPTSSTLHISDAPPAPSAIVPGPLFIEAQAGIQDSKRGLRYYCAPPGQRG